MGLLASVAQRSVPSARSAWVAMPLTVAAYLLFRYGIEGRFSLVLAQIVFVAPVLLASVSCGAAAAAGPAGNRERVLWILLSVLAGSLAASESYYSLMLLTASDAPPVVGMTFDALNAVAAGCFIGYVAVSASIERLGWRRVSRGILDVIAFLALGFTLLHAVWSMGVYSSRFLADPAEPIRLSAYALFGVVLLGAVAGLMWLTSGGRRHPWDLAVYGAFTVFGFGLLLWPLWNLAMHSERSLTAAAALANVMYLSGYFLLFIAGLLRLQGADQPWRDTAVYPSVTYRAWPGVLVSTAVTLAVVVMAWLFVSAEPGSVDSRLYLWTITVATGCLVGRTALAAAETAELRNRASMDGATGAYNMREFDVRITQMLSASRRFGEMFAVYAVDLEELTRTGDSADTRGADRRLAAAANRMREVDDGVLVFRHSGSEFLVLAPIVDRPDAQELGRMLAESIAGLGDATHPVGRASIGFALAPTDATDRDDLLRMASGARMWVKHHGGGKVFGYDERVVRSFGLEDRLQMIDERARRDMTRALAAAADARDPGNARHSRNVAALALLLAEDLGFDAARLGDLEVAAMLHDVGKIALPDPILTDRAISVRERKRVEEHADLGEHLVASVRIEGLPAWIRAHHERWDGNGYPDGLAGEEIPIEARIIALADAYDGMTTGKRYGAPMSKGAALQEIDLGLGTRFDPELGERFIALVGVTEALGWSDDWPEA